MMTYLIDASEIKNRFEEEKEYIQRYVDLANIRTSIFDHDVNEIRQILQKYGLPEFSISRNQSIRGQPYSENELKPIVHHLRDISEKIKSTIQDTNEEINMIEEPLGLSSVDYRSIKGEWIQYMIDALEGDLSEKNIETHKAEALRQISLQNDLGNYDGDKVDKSLIEYAVNSARYILTTAKLRSFFYLIDKQDDFEISLRIATPDAEINVLRQGFILLMTIFDAAIFDLMRVAVTDDFFNKISMLGEKDKVSLDEFANFESFQEFRDNLIERQLRNKHVKELLFILNKLGVPLVHKTKTITFAHLIELINRRNIHLHNRGRVDSQYLVRYVEKKNKYNVYNFSLGDVAVIDIKYWLNANDLVSQCVGNVSDWAVS